LFSGASAFEGADSLKVIATDGPTLTSGASLNSFFRNCPNITNPDFTGWDVSAVAEFSRMFQGCTAIDSLDLSTWDMANATNISFMFADLTGLDQIDVTGWSLPNLTSLEYTFSSLPVATIIGIDTWETSSSLLNMGHTFNATSLDGTLDISNFDMSGVTNMNFAFFNSTQIDTIVLGATTSALVDLDRAFEQCSQLVTVNTEVINTSGLTTLNNVFEDCILLESIDVSGWDVSGVTSAQRTFINNNAMDTLGVGSWNTSALANVTNMFRNCGQLDDLAIDSWDVTALTTATSFLQGASLPTSRYDDVLTSWEAQLVNNSVAVHFGGSTYTLGSAAATARAALIADHSWTITDGGGI